MNNEKHHPHLQQPHVSGCPLSKVEKAKIEYEVEAKKKMRDRELQEWNIAVCMAVIFFVAIWVVLKVVF